LRTSPIKSNSNVSWAVVDQFLHFVGQVASIIILAKLLSPADFAIFAIGAVVVGIVQQVLSLGLSQALIQFDDHEKYYATAWTSNLIIAFVVTLLLIAVLPSIISLLFQKYVDYSLYFQILSLSILLTGCNNIGLVELYKNQQINRLIFVRSFNKITLLITTVAFYFVYSDYRALVYGFVINSAIKAITTFVIAPNKSRFGLNSLYLKKLYSFGGWLHLKNTLRVIGQQIDSIVIANLMPLAALGFYSRATVIANTQETIVTNFGNLVTFPLLSKKKADKKYFEQIFDLNLNIVLLCTGVVSVIFLNYGHLAIELFLGEKWLPVFAPLSVLIVSAGLSALLISFFPYLRATGYPKIEFKLYAIKLLVLFVLIYPLTTHFGLTGAAFAGLISNIISFPIFVYALSLKMNIDLRKFSITSLVYLFVGVILVKCFPIISADSIYMVFELLLIILVYLLATLSLIYKLNPNSHFIVLVKEYLITMVKFNRD